MNPLGNKSIGRIATIPFDGFYESKHSNALDYMIDMEIEEGALEDDVYDHIDFNQAHRDYAKAYAERVINELNINGEFESMTSPRFYNFETDRVFITLTKTEAERLINSALKKENRKHFANLVKERFTSCDGFISFYSNNVEDWIDKIINSPDDLDHNEMGIILEVAHPDADFDEMQDDHVEYTQGNSGGYLDYLNETVE